MTDIFDAKIYNFPYTDIHFPGQAHDEVILYAAREVEVMKTFRILFVICAAITITLIGGLIGQMLSNILGFSKFIITTISIMFGGAFALIGVWWVSELWKKSIYAITNRRLVKIIYTTPWNRYYLSVTYDQVEDTGAYGRGYLQALLKIGTFSARSGAGNRAEKYFFVDNIKYYEDLNNYVNKVLFVFREDPHKLDNFRPFIPELKGEARKKFMEKYPEYWS